MSPRLVVTCSQVVFPGWRALWVANWSFLLLFCYLPHRGEEVDLDDHLVVAAPCGGPIALARDPTKVRTAAAIVETYRMLTTCSSAMSSRLSSCQKSIVVTIDYPVLMSHRRLVRVW